MIGPDPRILDKLLNGKEADASRSRLDTLEGTVGFVGAGDTSKLVLFYIGYHESGARKVAHAHVAYQYKTQLDLLPLRAAAMGEKVTCYKKGDYWWLDFGEKLGEYQARTFNLGL